MLRLKGEALNPQPFLVGNRDPLRVPLRVTIRATTMATIRLFRVLTCLYGMGERVMRTIIGDYIGTTIGIHSPIPY